MHGFDSSAWLDGIDNRCRCRTFVAATIKMTTAPIEFVVDADTAVCIKFYMIIFTFLLLARIFLVGARARWLLSLTHRAPTTIIIIRFILHVMMCIPVGQPVPGHWRQFRIYQFVIRQRRAEKEGIDRWRALTLATDPSRNLSLGSTLTRTQFAVAVCTESNEEE